MVGYFLFPLWITLVFASNVMVKLSWIKLCHGHLLSATFQPPKSKSVKEDKTQSSRRSKMSVMKKPIENTTPPQFLEVKENDVIIVPTVRNVDLGLSEIDFWSLEIWERWWNSDGATRARVPDLRCVDGGWNRSRRGGTVDTVSNWLYFSVHSGPSTDRGSAQEVIQLLC